MLGGSERGRKPREKETVKGDCLGSWLGAGREVRIGKVGGAMIQERFGSEPSPMENENVSIKPTYQ